MKLNALVLLGLAVVVPTLAPSEASAQPGGGYYSQPPPNSTLPGGFHNRQGRLTFGFSVGVGGMHDDFGDIECDGCEALSGQVSGHIGGFVAPRVALMFEAQANIQQVSQGFFVEDDVFLTQAAALVAAQIWVAPQLWVKGGLGLASLQLSDNAGNESQPENGTAVMGAIGYEVFSSRYMAVDIEGRLINGAYEGIDNNITAGSVGLGISWY